jgi:predicted amidophosphoribosyltransferase
VGIALFFLLALIAGGYIAYPLFAGRRGEQLVSAVSDRDIEQAVRNVRAARTQAGLNCPSCGQGYEPEDRFCVRCGQSLPHTGPAGPACPSCGAALQAEDRFCARCGAGLSRGEVA